MSARLVHRVLGRARWLVGRALHYSEVMRGARLASNSAYAPIFIVGAPRSGTTLTYQLLIKGLDVGWISNTHAVKPNSVVKVEQAAPSRAARVSMLDFESVHGMTEGEWGPSEAGEYWYRFFSRRQHQQSLGDVSRRRRRQVSAAIRLFAATCGAPIVFKNTLNSLRIPVLADALPEARFILVERNERDNSRSLLLGRLRRGGINVWWGAQPKSMMALIESGATPTQQVVEQVREISWIARADLATHAPNRWISVHYDDICNDPREVLTKVRQWLNDQGVSVGEREIDSVPSHFERRIGGHLSDDLEHQLDEAIKVVREDARQG